MKIYGELKDNKIIVERPKDVGRLYNKSRFGKTITGNKLEINLLEGVFLLDEEKIRIFRDKKEFCFQDLVPIASRYIPKFETRYLIFRDLRKRGCAVKLNENDKQFDFYIDKKDDGKSCLISAFSERNIMNMSSLSNIIKNANKKNADLWIVIADEEGDITYYDVSSVNPKGKTHECKYPKTEAVLLESRVIIFDRKIAKEMLEKEFYGKPFGEGLQLSIVEVLYLLKKKKISLKDVSKKTTISLKKFKELAKKIQEDIDLRIIVFDDLKKRGLIVKTGFKFGTHFRAYTKKPDETHAEYLVHAVDKDFKSIWAEVSRVVRLSHSVNKEILFARIYGEKIEYIKFGRLRP